MNSWINLEELSLERLEWLKNMSIFCMKDSQKDGAEEEVELYRNSAVRYQEEINKRTKKTA